MYSDISEMASSSSLVSRIIACASTQGIDNPAQWVSRNLYKIVSSPGWDSDWRYAVENATVNSNPDTGARTDVINDNKILAAVQAVKTAEEPQGE